MDRMYSDTEVTNESYGCWVSPMKHTICWITGYW